MTVRCPVERSPRCPDNPYAHWDIVNQALVLCPAWEDLSSDMQAVWALAPIMGALTWEDGWRMAEFARELYEMFELGRRVSLQQELGMGSSARP